MAVAASACDATAVEVFHPVAVEPSTEYALALVHIAIYNVAWFQAVIWYGQGHLYFGGLQGYVNACNCGHLFPFGYCRDRLAIFGPSGEKLHVVCGCPRTELTSLKGAGVLVH